MWSLGNLLLLLLPYRQYEVFLLPSSVDGEGATLGQVYRKSPLFSSSKRSFLDENQANGIDQGYKQDGDMHVFSGRSEGNSDQRVDEAISLGNKPQPESSNANNDEESVPSVLSDDSWINLNDLCLNSLEVRADRLDIYICILLCAQGITS